MIIVLNRDGQMCNQLFTLAAAYALGLEYKNDVLCPVMDERLKQSFVFKRADKVPIRVKMYCSNLGMLFKISVKIIRKLVRFNIDKKYDIRKDASQIQVFLSRISFMDDFVFAKHLEEIRSYFDFAEDIKKFCSDNIEAIKADGKMLVGVHIRRGDYKTFENGKWYYSDEDYADWMTQLAEESNIRFVLSSNEKLDLDFYQSRGLDVMTFSANAVQDLCYLGMCDYIMGPPSTYSVWAALWGNKKRCSLYEKGLKISFDDFLSFEERVKNNKQVEEL